MRAALLSIISLTVALCIYKAAFDFNPGILDSKFTNPTRAFSGFQFKSYYNTTINNLPDKYTYGYDHEPEMASNTSTSIEDVEIDNFNTWKLDKGRRHQYWLQSSDVLPYNRTRVAERQIKRHTRINEVCKSLTEKPLNPKVGYHSNIVALGELLYCPILKAGSTNILRLFCWLYGPPCSNIKNLHPHNQVPRYLERAGKVAVGNTPEFKGYFSFTIVRDPWRRLVSVYIQKFVETKQGLVFCQFQKRFPSYFNVSRSLSFTEYLDLCVIGQYKEGGILNQNPHYRPQYQMCAFCYLDYTFIGKMETMNEDEKVIAHAMGFKDIDKTIEDAKDKLLPNEKQNKSVTLYSDLWRSVSPGSIETLKEIYHLDILMFNYPDHPDSLSQTNNEIA